MRRRATRRASGKRTRQPPLSLTRTLYLFLKQRVDRARGVEQIAHRQRHLTHQQVVPLAESIGDGLRCRTGRGDQMFHIAVESLAAVIAPVQARQQRAKRRKLTRDPCQRVRKRHDIDHPTRPRLLSQIRQVPANSPSSMRAPDIMIRTSSIVLNRQALRKRQWNSDAAPKARVLLSVPPPDVRPCSPICALRACGSTVGGAVPVAAADDARVIARRGGATALSALARSRLGPPVACCVDSFMCCLLGHQRSPNQGDTIGGCPRSAPYNPRGAGTVSPRHTANGRPWP
jgi:hypothetical protein